MTIGLYVTIISTTNDIRSSMIEVLKALAEIHRLYILASCSQQEVYTCQIVSASGMSQSTVSSHLKILRSAGLLSVSKINTWSAYFLNPSIPGEIRDIIKPVLAGVYKDTRWQSFHERILDSDTNVPCEERKER